MINNNSKLANAVSQSEKFPRKLNIQNSALLTDGIGEFVKWYREFYRDKNE